MQGKYHLALGIATGITVGLITADGRLMPAAATLLSCGFAELVPDLDSATSNISQKAKLVSFVVRKLYKRRGDLHTPFFLSILMLILSIITIKYNLPYQIMNGFFVGYMMHLIQDTLTPRGIMWLYPFSKERYSLNLIKSNDKYRDVKEIFYSALICLSVSGLYALNFVIQV